MAVKRGKDLPAAIGKGLIRSLNRSATVSGKMAPMVRKRSVPREPAGCDRCGAMYLDRTWRRDHRLSNELFERINWTICPACEQVVEGEYFGRVLLRGKYPRDNEAEIRRRIANVAARAAHTQPERRIVSVERDRQGIEVLTTSQKLAHRITRELKKAFGGRATYRWSDSDGTLTAIWERQA
jgi:NMD protein affecting ribosome stability and mRNA decay